jgi:hypothetical protein
MMYECLFQHLSAILTISNMKHKKDIQRQTFSMIQCMMAGVRMHGVMACKVKVDIVHSSGADPDPGGSKFFVRSKSDISVLEI